MPFRIKPLLWTCVCMMLLMLFNTWSEKRVARKLHQKSESYQTVKFVQYMASLQETTNHLTPTSQDEETTTQGLSKAIQTKAKTYHRPRFTFSMEPKGLFDRSCKLEQCIGDQGIRWTTVHFIKSSAGNFLRREFLRRTWGSVRYIAGGRYATVFLVGRSSGEILKLLQDEDERYGDILQFDGPDDYGNIPLKTLAGMQWAADNLPQSYFYSSGDDDFMINPGYLQDVIDEKQKLVQAEKWAEFPIICTYRTLDGGQPYRSANGTYKKWYISPSEYKWPLYPRGCFGGFYSASVSVISQLYDISRDVPQLRVDDIWITGILRTKLGMPESMVITPNMTIAEHLVGYRKKRARTRREFMMPEWEKVRATFSKKKTCYC